MNDSSIKVESISKSFRLPHEKQASIKNLLIHLSQGGKRSYDNQQVLKNISFDIKKGEFFGIIGRNGSGKSTLLKIIAGIYSPDQGSVQVNGKLTPFIELGVGFNPELTGRENVYLNGALLGFSRKEVDRLYDDIVDFAELEKFMDQKLKNYSSGMQVRLAFSIAIQAKSDILVLDEVLAVGDYEFQQKCFEYFKFLKKNKRTVVLVSHDMTSIQQFCTSGIYIENGQVVASGKISDVTAAYTAENTRRAEITEEKAKKISKKKMTGTGAAIIEEVYTENPVGKRAAVFSPDEDISICFKIRARDAIHSPVTGMIFSTGSGQVAFATNSLDQKIKAPDIEKGATLVVRYTIKNRFDDGLYYVSGAIANENRSIVYARLEQAHEFRSIGWQTTAKATYYPEHRITFS